MNCHDSSNYYIQETIAKTTYCMTNHVNIEPGNNSPQKKWKLTFIKWILATRHESVIFAPF